MLSFMSLMAVLTDTLSTSSFHANRRMAAEVDELINVGDEGEETESYSDINFAYGSTPIGSFVKVQCQSTFSRTHAQDSKP